MHWDSESECTASRDREFCRGDIGRYIVLLIALPGEDGPARLECESTDGEGVRSCMGSVTVLEGGGVPGCESMCVCARESWSLDS